MLLEMVDSLASCNSRIIIENFMYPCIKWHMKESACLQLYHKAMKHQQDGEFAEAKHLYQEILESEVMEELCASGRGSGADGTSGEIVAQASTITRLKYLIYKNLASIAKERGDYSAAVDAYIEVYVCCTLKFGGTLS